MNSQPTQATFSPDMVDGGTQNTLVLTVPYANETADEAMQRAQLAINFGLLASQVPMARRDDTGLEIEYTVTNTGTQDGIAFVKLTGANEFWKYDPNAFVTDPEEQSPPPPLAGGKPLMVKAGTTFSGVIDEQQMSEAAQDLDAFTRAGLTPQFAILTQWPTGDVTGGMAPLPTIPSVAIPLLLESDLTLTADIPMTLQATLRVRDKSGRLTPNPMDPGILMRASTTVFMPPPAPPP